MVLVHHFNSTNLWKAFILNSILTSLLILIAIVVKKRIDLELDLDSDDSNQKQFNWYGVTVTLLITFGTSLLAYLIMYVVFGFGGGMLSKP